MACVDDCYVRSLTILGKSLLNNFEPGKLSKESAFCETCPLTDHVHDFLAASVCFLTPHGFGFCNIVFIFHFIICRLYVDTIKSLDAFLPDYLKPLS